MENQINDQDLFVVETEDRLETIQLVDEAAADCKIDISDNTVNV
jgi:hypothetical protein